MELLCPAGSMIQLKTALHFGADAVYGGMKQYGLRAFAGNFSESELAEAVKLCHEKGKRFYLTLNIFPFDDQMEGLVACAKTAQAIGVDAAIVSDLGAIVTLREEVPDLKIHVSTQASICNSAAIRHLAALGCSRVILAREVSLERMREIRKQIPDSMELECFVHGAACMAWSGRCLLSAELAGRSGNQGACAQSCRWKYAVMEEKRPGEYLPVAEDLNGTYIFSARDLNLMPYLPDLAEAGISSLKIEGRMKTEYYTAVHRLSDTGFLLGAPRQPGGAEGFHQSREYVARALEGTGPDGEAVFELKNRFYAGETLELMTAQGIRKVTASGIRRLKTGEVLDTFGIAGERIALGLGTQVEAGDLLRGPVRNHRT